MNKIIYISTVFLLAILFFIKAAYAVEVLGITWSNSDLVTFDLFSGTITQRHLQLNKNENYRGLAYDSTHNELFALSQSSHHLYAINPYTLEIALIGKLNIDKSLSWSEDIGGLAYDPVSDSLYTVVSHWNSNYTDIWSELVEIDQSTAEITYKGYITNRFTNSLSYNVNDGQLYAFAVYEGGNWDNPNKSNLVSINPENANMTTLFETPYHTILGLTKKPNENIFYSWINWTSHFYGEVNLGTETITPLGNSNQVGVTSDAILYKDIYVAAIGDAVNEILKSNVPLITVDGNLFEYTDANAVEFFPSSGGNTVTVRVLWDDEALYIAFKVIDTQLNASVTARDGNVWNDDSVEWFIDTLNDDGGSDDPNSPYMLPDDYHGKINILNTQYDSQGTVSGNPASSWDGIWESAVQISGTINNNTDIDSGYTVEVKIPWTSIGYSIAPAGDILVGMSFALNDLDDSLYSNVMWSDNTSIVFENVSNFQQVLISNDIICPPVKIAGVNEFYYYSLQNAYDEAVDGNTIQNQKVELFEDLIVDMNKSTILEAGYDCNYTHIDGMTTVNGNIIISNGTLIIHSGTLEVR
jgi:hypothetical protein